MWRFMVSIGLILALGGGVARASAIGLFVSGFPTTYRPGSTLIFDVGLQGAADLNAYDVGLALNSNKGTAGSDFAFVGSPGTTRPADGADRYVFDADLSVAPFGFVATADKVAGTNTALLSLSDFLESGQSVADASPNTMLATVVIETTAAAGNLTLSFDGSPLELLTPGGQAVNGFGTLAANLGSFNPPTAVAQVPEPATFTLLCAVLGLAGTAAGWRRRSWIARRARAGKSR